MPNRSARWSRRRPQGLDRSTCAECLDGGWKLRGRLRSDEHDVITDGERRLIALSQAQNLGDRQVDERSLVRDLGDRRSVEEFASDGTDCLFETIYRLPLPLDALVAPELDFDADGVRARFQFVGEPLDRALGNPVRWSPRTKLTQAVEQIEPGAEPVNRTLPGLVPIP